MLTFTPQAVRVPEMCRSLRHDECGWDKQILRNRRTLAPGGHGQVSHQLKPTVRAPEHQSGAAALVRLLSAAAALSVHLESEL